MICGGTPRDRYLGHLENISDLDITTGDKTVDYLSQEFYELLGKKYNITRKSHADGHSTIYIGNFKVDFSSNFIVPNIDQMLSKQGISQPTDIQKEMFSRDFTCNALLLSLDLKNLTDPTHRGLKDIKDHTIRTCLPPEITLTSNKNRVIRAIYLSAKLDFDIDQNIIDFVTSNPSSVKISAQKTLVEKMQDAFKYNPERASYYLTKMNLWKEVPITETARPYYMRSMKKKAYFQGGGGASEPTPGKQKYPVDKAIVVQPRFVEPFYRNYDVYQTEGVDGPPKLGPGAGWHHMMNYKSIKEFLAEKRQHMKDKYKAEDSWIENTPKNYQERVDGMKLRAKLLSRIEKYGQRNYDLGKGLYENMDKYKSVEDFRDNHDVSLIDFPLDEQINSGHIAFNQETVEQPRFLGPEGADGDMSEFPGATGLGDEQAYPYSAEIGGEVTYPAPDFEGKTPVQLDFGRDYVEDELPEDMYMEMNQRGPDTTPHKDILQKILDKYVVNAPHGLYGLPDGVDLPDEDLGDPTDINPDYGTIGPDSLMYEDKWNI